MKNNKMIVSAVEKFLTANGNKLDNIRTIANARKQDSKNLAADAPRFLALNTKRSNKLNDFVESFKSKLFSDVKETFNVFFGKDIIGDVFAESAHLDTLPCIAQVKKSLLMKFKQDDISDEILLSGLKTALVNHNKATIETRNAKLANLSTKAKAICNGNEKQNLVAFLVKIAEAKAEAEAKAAAKVKTPKVKAAAAGASLQSAV